MVGFSYTSYFCCGLPTVEAEDRGCTVFFSGSRSSKGFCHALYV